MAHSPSPTLSGRQSIDDREAITLDLVELAEITLRDLLEFGGDAARMRAGDRETLGQNITETVAKQLTHAVVQLDKIAGFVGLAVVRAVE